MSFSLGCPGTEPGIEIKTHPAVDPNECPELAFLNKLAGKLHFQCQGISVPFTLALFWVMKILTKTPLSGPNDPRMQFIRSMKAMKKVDGFTQIPPPIKPEYRLESEVWPLMNDNEEAKTPPQIHELMGLKIGLQDALFIAYYILTNTNLTGEADVRLKFLASVQAMDVADVEGEEGKKRLVTSVPFGPVD